MVVGAATPEAPATETRVSSGEKYASPMRLNRGIERTRLLDFGARIDESQCVAVWNSVAGIGAKASDLPVSTLVAEKRSLAS